MALLLRPRVSQLSSRFLFLDAERRAGLRRCSGTLLLILSTDTYKLILIKRSPHLRSEIFGGARVFPSRSQSSRGWRAACNTHKLTWAKLSY
jgi:hypothetical protein